MKIPVLASFVAIFISESSGNIRYWTQDEVDLIQSELEKFQKIDEDRDVEFVGSLMGSVYVLQNEMFELAQDFENGKSSAEGSGHLEAAIDSLSLNMANLKRLLEEAETFSKEYAAQLERKWQAEQLERKRRAEQEEEEKWKQEENHLGLDSTGGLAKGVSFFFFY